MRHSGGSLRRFTPVISAIITLSQILTVAIVLQSCDTARPGAARIYRIGSGESIELGNEAVQPLRIITEVSENSLVQFEIKSPDPNLDIDLISPQGIILKERSSWRELPIRVSQVSEISGTYSLEIECHGTSQSCGPITLRLDIRSPEDGLDRERVRAEEHFDRGENLSRLYERASGERAVQEYTAALSIWENSGDLSEAAVTALRLGGLRERLGNPEGALEYYEKGLSLSRRTGDPEILSKALSINGLATSTLRNLEAGRAMCLKAFQLAAESSLSEAKATALNCLGEVEYQSGNLTQSLQHYLEAEAIQINLADRWGLAETAVDLASIYVDLSEFNQATDKFEEAMIRWQELGDLRGQALTLKEEARVYERMGEFQRALNSLNQAMRLIEPMGDPILEAGVLAGIGQIYETLGQWKNAVTYWNRAFELFQEMGFKLAALDMLLGVGELQLKARELDKAQGIFETALELSDELSTQRMRVAALRFLGQTYQAKDNLEKALEYFQRTLSGIREEEWRQLEARVRCDIGETLERLGKPHKAQEEYTEALSLSRSAGDPMIEALANYHLARLLADDGNPAEAMRHIEQAVHLAESLRSQVMSRDMAAYYLDSSHRYYELQIELLMQPSGAVPEGNAAEGLKVSEQARARSLLDNLSEARVDIRKGIDPELLSDERAIGAALDERVALLMEVMSAESRDPRIPSLEQEIRELSRRYDQLKSEIRSKNPHYASLTQPRPLAVAAIQEHVLDGDTLLLEYSLGERKSFLWLLSRQSISSYELPSRAEIERNVRKLYELLTSRHRRPDESVRDYRLRIRKADSDYEEAAQRLSQMLIGPVGDRLGSKRLLIVSDGALQYVPFGLLPISSGKEKPTPLIVDHEVILLPSASTLAALRNETIHRTPARQTIMVLADPVFDRDDSRITNSYQKENKAPAAKPPLEASSSSRAIEARWLDGGKLSLPRLIMSRREAEEIIGVVPPGSSRLAVDFEASRETATSAEISNYQYLHFATHAVVDGTNPSLTGIFLSMVDERGHPQNGFLRLQDIYNLEIGSELVVLSACDSALGEELRGEGLMGIARGFMYAGAKSVIASLWKVDDEATMELMSRFYRKMFRENRSPSDALRQAQIEMMQQSGWSSPFYWAAFTFQGEWQ